MQCNRENEAFKAKLNGKKLTLTGVQLINR